MSFQAEKRFFMVRVKISRKKRGRFWRRWAEISKRRQQLIVYAAIVIMSMSRKRRCSQAMWPIVVNEQ